MLAVGAGGGCLDIFSLICHFSLLSSSLREKARYRLKYCLKGPLSPKQPNNQHLKGPLGPEQPTNHCFLTYETEFILSLAVLENSVLPMG